MYAIATNLDTCATYQVECSDDGTCRNPVVMQITPHGGSNASMMWAPFFTESEVHAAMDRAMTECLKKNLGLGE